MYHDDALVQRSHQQQQAATRAIEDLVRTNQELVAEVRRKEARTVRKTQERDTALRESQQLRGENQQLRAELRALQAQAEQLQDACERQALENSELHAQLEASILPDHAIDVIIADAPDQEAAQGQDEGIRSSVGGTHGQRQ